MTDVSQKLDSGLTAILNAARSKSPGAVERQAHVENVPLKNGLLRVKIIVNKIEDVAAVEKLIAASGGEVGTKLGVVIFAMVPTLQLEKIASDPRVWNMTVPAIAAHPMSQ